MNNPKTIYVHCSATPEGRYFDAADIDRWHRDRGWSNGVGYHAVILLDGTREIGRDPDGDGISEEHMGAHVYGHNRDSLGVCYIGGVDGNGKPKDTRTAEQKTALLQSVSEWMDEFDIPLTRVYGHYEADPGKACPSFDMGQFRKDLQELRRAGSSSNTSVATHNDCSVSLYRQGDRGGCVREIQVRVNSWADAETVWLAHISEDGIFGHNTTRRVMHFQTKKGLSVDGIVGPDTWAALQQYSLTFE